MNAASLSTASHVSSGGLRMDNCSLVHSWRASAAMSDATIGPVSTLALLGTLVVIGENRLVQIPLAGRSVPRTAAHRADQVAGEVGAGEFAARRRALHEGGFERLADDAGLRDPAAARLGGDAAAQRGRQLERHELHDAVVKHSGNLAIPRARTSSLSAHLLIDRFHAIQHGLVREMLSAVPASGFAQILSKIRVLDQT